MDKERLKQYPQLVKELEELNFRIERMEAKCEYSSVILYDMPKGTISHDYLDKLADLKMLRERLRAKILCEIVAIEKFISDIEESRVRLIFRYRYIDGITWDDIGEKMDYSRIQIIRIHDAYMKKSF